MDRIGGMGRVGVDFTERRLARLSGADLFATAYTDPVPSPDGTLLAWISDRDGRPGVWVAPLPADGSPVVEPDRPLPTDTGDVQALSWSPDGAWLACQLAPGGGERTRVQLVAPSAGGAHIDTARNAGGAHIDTARNGSGARLETAPASGEVRDIAPGAAAVTLGAWSPGGRQLGVTVFGEGSGDGQACLVDVRDGTSTVLASGPAARVCAVSGDGKRAVVRLGRRGARRLELVDLWTGRRTELLPGGASVADARFGITGRQLYVHTDAGRERPGLLAVTLTDSGPSAVYTIAERTGDDLDVVALDPGGARAVLVWNTSGRSETELLDLRTGMLEPVAAAPGDVVTGAAFTRDGRALLVASEGPTVTPRLSWVGLGPGESAAPLLPARPDHDTTLVAPSLQEFPGEDGLGLSGWLFRPRGALGPLPTLIWLHGGPEAQERPVFQPLFQALLTEGVAVFAPNVRGSGGYGRSFASADDRERRFTAITDVRAAVDHLVSTGMANPTRIGVSGRSYGGYLTLAALAWFPDLFAVGVDVCGISDFTTFYARTEPWIATAAITKYGDPDHDALLLRELSPIHRVAWISAPLLVVHGAHDTNVPLTEAQQIVDALRERGAAPGFLLFPDEGHEVRDRENRAVFVREVARWVTAHLMEIGERTA